MEKVSSVECLVELLESTDAVFLKDALIKQAKERLLSKDHVIRGIAHGASLIELEETKRLKTARDKGYLAIKNRLHKR